MINLHQPNLHCNICNHVNYIVTKYGQMPFKIKKNNKKKAIIIRRAKKLKDVIKYTMFYCTIGTQKCTITPIDKYKYPALLYTWRPG